MLKDADVFITNVRNGSLRKVGLDYQSLHSEFPHLVYGQVSAYGVSGPATLQPGYDLGAFWAATGMSAMIHQPGCTSHTLSDTIMTHGMYRYVQSVPHRLR